MNIELILTVGGYGYTKESFVGCLLGNDVDVLVDIRQRRGMRGKSYSFLNSLALQSMLKDARISYDHIKLLAPTTAVRTAQKDADLVAGMQKRSRLRLSVAFVDAYRSTVLDALSPEVVLDRLGSYHRPCFFCVESHSAACHRSLAADWLAKYADLPVKNL